MERVLCVICQQTNTEKVNSFTKKTLNKCRIASEIRKKFNLKYCDVILPLELSSDKGFHRQCYSNFTTLKKKYKEDLSTSYLESPPTSDIPPRSDVEVDNVETIPVDPGFENNISPPDNPPTSFQIADNIEIVPAVSELNDSASFLDNPVIEQVVETGETVQIEPHLQGSGGDIFDESIESSVQENLGPNPEPTAADLDASSINSDVCIFCTKARRKVKGKHVPLYSIEKKAMVKNLEPYKEYLEDTVVYKHLQNSEDVKAHRICRVEYMNSLRIYDNKPKTEYRSSDEDEN